MVSCNCVYICGTKWPYMCWSALIDYNTHSLTMKECVSEIKSVCTCLLSFLVIGIIIEKRIVPIEQMSVVTTKVKVKGKGTHTCVEHRGPELIPDCRQSACGWQHAWSWTQWWAAATSHQAHSDTHMHIMNPVIGCHYFLPGPQLPSQPSGVTAFRPVPTDTA